MQKAIVSIGIPLFTDSGIWYFNGKRTGITGVELFYSLGHTGHHLNLNRNNSGIRLIKPHRQVWSLNKKIFAGLRNHPGAMIFSLIFQLSTFKSNKLFAI